jgi:hypothetical protein
LPALIKAVERNLDGLFLLCNKPEGQALGSVDPGAASESFGLFRGTSISSQFFTAAALQFHAAAGEAIAQANEHFLKALNTVQQNPLQQRSYLPRLHDGTNRNAGPQYGKQVLDNEAGDGIGGSGRHSSSPVRRLVGGIEKNLMKTPALSSGS